MLKNINCFWNQKHHHSFQYNYHLFIFHILIAKRCLGNIKDLGEYLEKHIVENSLRDVIEYDCHLLDDSYYETIRKHYIEIETINHINESLNAHQKRHLSAVRSYHHISATDKKKLIEQLENKIKNNIIKYNSELSTFIKIQKFCFKKQLFYQDIYFKFGRDKDGLLIAIYFDINEFFHQGTKRYPNGWAYIISGSDSCFKNDASLCLTYKTIDQIPLSFADDRMNEYIKNLGGSGNIICIDDIISRYHHHGYGTFLIEEMFSIIREINKKIGILGSNFGLNHVDKPIIAIYGFLVPGSNISYEALVGFYHHHGLKTYDKRTTSEGTISNNLIFQEV